MALQAPLLGGLFIGVLSALPIVSMGNCLCCMWVVGGGLLAAYLDQQYDPRPTTPGRGAMAGFLAGIIGALVWLLVAAVVDVVFAPVREWAVQELTRIARDMPPEARDALESMAGESAGGYAVMFFVMLCVGAIFSTIGGLIGAALFKSDAPPALGGAAPPPIPPQ